MRTPVEIRNELVAALNGSVNWKKLQNSVIGRELIYFGVNVINQSDAVLTSMINAFDYKTADQRSLISISHSLDIPVSFTRPPYVRVRVLGQKVYKPFELVYSVGGINFYNIEYAKAGSEVTLYQGVVRNMNQSTDNISGLEVSASEVWDDTQILNDTTTPIIGHNLGNAHPDSIYVFYKNESGVGEVSPFTPLRADSEAELFKVMTLMDKSQLLMLGDGVWGKSEYPSTEFQIVWLESTANPFELNGRLSDSTGIIQDFEILSSAQGEIDDISYARDSIARWFLSNSVVASEQQYIDFVKSYPFVQDAAITSINNNVSVYVKPTDPDEVGNLSAIAAELDLRGVIFSQHSISQGTPLLFTLILTGDHGGKQSQVEDFITKELAYKKLSYNYRLDLALITALIQRNFGINLSTQLNVITAPTSGETLKFLPIEGTIKVLSSEGNIAGYDKDGVILVGMNAGARLPEKENKCVAINDIVFVGEDNPMALVPHQPVILLESECQDPLNKSFEYIYSIKDDNLKLWRASSFKLGTWHKNIPEVLSVSTIAESGETLSGIPIYHNGLIYFLSENKGVVKLAITTVVRNEEKVYLEVVYTLAIQTQNKVEYILKEGSTLYLFYHENDMLMVARVLNFDNSTYSYDILETEFIGIDSKIVGVDTNNEDKFAVSYDGSKIYLHRISAMSPKDGVLRISTEKIFDNTVDLGEDPVISVGDEILTINSTTCVNKIITQSEAFSINDVNIHQKLTEAGFVDYASGLYTRIDGQSNKIEYISQVVNDLDASVYLKLNEETPVVWK